MKACGTSTLFCSKRDERRVPPTTGKRHKEITPRETRQRVCCWLHLHKRPQNANRSTGTDRPVAARGGGGRLPRREGLVGPQHTFAEAAGCTAVCGFHSTSDISSTPAPPFNYLNMHFLTARTLKLGQIMLQATSLGPFNLDATCLPCERPPSVLMGF